ncbi:hypothetical protein [Endozoicomonas atrinae]|uniref:hypothetical protein n=1 Tax=Endozoicomonas atrinae TaxID=1333660 RepID=UPI000825E40E|nr:hypothetical protein [Endozoicomonas atrinae]
MTRLPKKLSEVCLVDNPETQTQKELNLLLVTDSLKEEFGCMVEAMKAVDQKAHAMGVTRKGLQDMAQINPSSFKKLMGLGMPISVADTLSGNRSINFIQSSSVDDGGNTKILTTQNTGHKSVSSVSHQTQQVPEAFLPSQKTNNQPMLQTNNITPVFTQPNRPTEKKLALITVETAQVHALYDTLNPVPSSYPATAAPATTSCHIPQVVPQDRRYHTPMDLLTVPPRIPQLETNSHKQNVQASNIAPAMPQLPRYPEKKAAHIFVRDNRVNTFHETPGSVQPIYPITSAPEATSYPTAKIIHHDMRYNVQAELLTAHHLPAQHPPCTAPFSEIPFTPSEPSNYLYVHRVFEESLLVYLPHTNTTNLHEDHLLEENLRKIELILQILYQRLQGDIRYKLVKEHEIQHIDDCINALTPWFNKFHIPDQVKYTELETSLKYLTKPVENGKIDQTFRDLVNDQIRQGNINEAAQIIRVQQGLFHVREVLGLSVNYAS